ncbi:MAG: GNAT family N-acetyltransferase [Ktedonobacteraceae bacterium]|nr:GNAT family N-acetyltransferase [Ktedonobacteraceae bacterium]
MTIFFYGASNKPYGCFSNFSRHGFELDGAWWPTSEHYFQAQKFAGTPFVDQVRQTPTPKEAAKMGRRRSLPLRADWEEVKDQVMLQGVLRKFETHTGIRAILLATGEEEVVEKAPRDYYWGCGADGSGQNKLGQTLMTVRTLLRGREARQPEIRRATTADVVSIASVLLASFVEYEPAYTREGFAATTPQQEQIQRRMSEGPVWVALLDGAIVGTVSAFIKGEVLYIRGMAILPGARGQNIGTRLLEQAEEFAVTHGCSHLFLGTTPFLTRAIRLYERYGFQRIDEGPHDLFGTPLFTMIKTLKPGTSPSA